MFEPRLSGCDEEGRRRISHPFLALVVEFSPFVCSEFSTQLTSPFFPPGGTTSSRLDLTTSMALPSLSAAFGFPTPPPPHGLLLTAAAGTAQSEEVASYASPPHYAFSQQMSSTFQLSPRPSNDGDFDHDVHSDCSSISK